MNAATMRWRDYALFGGDANCLGFWTAHLSERERNLLFILGRGFDPRMCVGTQIVLNAGGSGQRDVFALDFHEGTTSPSIAHLDRVEHNWRTLTAAIGSRGSLRQQSIECLSSEGRRITSQSARDIVSSSDFFKTYTDIVVDVSAMPRSVYFPLIARILYWLDKIPLSSTPVNLHVLVAEDPKLDASILELGIDEKADFMASFRGGFAEEAIQTPKVWLPLLGEGKTTQFDRLLDLVNPDEICPVLPSPSRNPRRGDDIIVAFQRKLFDEKRLDPREFLYASEHNPFEVYRQIRSAVLHYKSVFKLLDGCKIAVSVLSSKLMSLGPLLVAYEFKGTENEIGVAHVECQGYGLPPDSPTQPEVFNLWLAGECYAAQ